MNETSKQILELFVEKFKYLDSLGFEEHARERGLGFHAARQEDGTWTMDFDLPDEANRDAFLMTFRLFIQDKDDISLPRLANLVHDNSSLSKAWREEVGNIREMYFKYLEGYPTRVSRDFFDGAPNRDQIMRTVLYGAISHARVRSKERTRYLTWTGDEIRAAVLGQVFTRIIVTIMPLIRRIAQASERELLSNT